MNALKSLDHLLKFLHFPIWILLSPLRLINKIIADSKRISVIKLAAMGDIICLYPAIYSLNEKGYNVTLITTERSNPVIFRDCKALHRILVLSLHPKYFFQSAFFVLHNILYARFCINADQYYNVSKFFSYTCNSSIGFETSKNTQFFKFPITYSYTDNEKLQFMKLASCVNGEIKTQLPKTDIFTTKRKIEKNPVFDDCILMHPGSGPSAQIRRWPIQKWVSLYRKLTEKGLKCKFIGGPDEVSSVPYFLESRVPLHDIHINLYNLFDLIESMRFARAFIGNDAGLFHIADALCLPIVGIFGPNLSSKWGSMQKSSVHVEVDLQCRPCIVNVDGKIPNHCRLGTLDCLKNIEVTDVLNAVEQVDTDNSNAFKKH